MAELVPDDAHVDTPPTGGVLGLLSTVVTWWAMAGGAVFCALVAMSIVSIVGRKLFATPIQGDMEVLMMGAAIGSAAFLPAFSITFQLQKGWPGRYRERIIRPQQLPPCRQLQVRSALPSAERRNPR